MLDFQMHKSETFYSTNNSANKESIMKNSTKILLVDDLQINIKVATLLLNELGFSNIIFANNGQKAVDVIDDSFDLVLLDIGLPDICGLDVCKLIRKKLIKQIPIIAVTAFTDGDYDKYNLAGINDVLIKPLNLNTLENKIKQWTRNHCANN